MNISSVGSQDVIESISRMNNLIKNIAAAEMDLDNKFTKLNVIAKVTGVGENIDYSV